MSDQKIPCPFCGKELNIGVERFRGAGQRVVRPYHTHNGSADCLSSGPPDCPHEFAIVSDVTIQFADGRTHAGPTARLHCTKCGDPAH